MRSCTYQQAKGFQQVWGRDFSKTTLPTAHLESLHIILHIATVNNWCIEQYDIKTAFLNGILPEKERQYMEQPPGFAQPDREAHVWELHHGLYGMWQLSRIWNHMLNSSFLSWGFLCSKCKWCMYTCCSDHGNTSIVAVHVNNMLTTSSTRAEANRFWTELESAWQNTALGEPKLVVGITLHQDRAKKTIMLSQTTLINKIISAYGQADAKTATTPIAHGTQLLKPSPLTLLDDTKCERLTTLPYHSLVGSLMYIASESRPDIMFTVSKLSCFLDCYHETHWQAAVCVVQYLKGTRDMGLVLGSSSPSLPLIGYCDSDYMNDPSAEV